MLERVLRRSDKHIHGQVNKYYMYVGSRDNKDEERREKFTAVRRICEEPLSIFFKFPPFLFPIFTKISRIILVQNLLKLVADSFIVLQQQYHDKRLKGLAKVSNIC